MSGGSTQRDCVLLSPPVVSADLRSPLSSVSVGVGEIVRSPALTQHSVTTAQDTPWR
jgi:hypothetical protein